MREVVEEKFQEIFKKTPSIIVRSPARINLIGEHTDYNMGFVLPAAIDREIIFAIAPNHSNRAIIFALNFNEKVTINLDNLPSPQKHWVDYLVGVLEQFAQKSLEVKGFDLVFGGNIPTGAGLSSSAAVECGLAFGLNQLFDFQLSNIDLVKISQKAENQFVGVQCGIMDQFASMMGQASAVILLDCQSLAYRYLPFLQENHTLVLCDTGVKHALGDSEYNLRRQECERGVAILQKHDPTIVSLRDLSLDFLEKHQSDFDEITYKRCHYVVAEITRVQTACLDLAKNDLAAFGKKMYKTHAGLQNDYAVSCPELDFLVAQTQDNSGVLGARMMGGGFGGCTINLVEKLSVDSFIQNLTLAYKTTFNLDLLCHKVSIVNGTSLM